MTKVAVIRTKYLPVSETFIYSELVHLRRTKPILCTKKVTNLAKFPFKPIFRYKNANDLIGILKKQNAKLIHARFGVSEPELLEVKKKLGIPMITSFHGFDLPSNKVIYKQYGKNLKQLFRQGDAFTANSDNHRQILIRYGCPPEKVYTHYSGIDTNKFVYKKREVPAEGKIRILSIGRLVEKKGMRYLIEAFREVHQKYPNARLRIVGDGGLLEELKRLVHSLRLDGKVKFLGALSHDQVLKEIQSAHLFALASITSKTGDQEGIPNVLKEAMACGLPVVSTRHAGIPELVQHRKSGLLVSERDVHALAKALKKLVDNPNKWVKMGRAGRKIVEKHFDLNKQIKHLEQLYSKVLDQK